MTVNNELLQLKTVFLPAYIDLTKQSSDKANQSVTHDALLLCSYSHCVGGANKSFLKALLRYDVNCQEGFSVHIKGTVIKTKFIFINRCQLCVHLKCYCFDR